MSGAESGALVVPEQPPVAELHLHRGPGVGWGIVALVLFGLGLVMSGSYLAQGRWVSGVVFLVLPLIFGWGISRIALPMLRTRLTADAEGVRGRTPKDQVIEVGWDAIGIDAAEGRLLLTIGEETIGLTPEGWVGLSDFVALLYRLPAAAARMTPAACRQTAEWLERSSSLRRPPPS